MWVNPTLSNPLKNIEKSKQLTELTKLYDEPCSTKNIIKIVEKLSFFSDAITIFTNLK